MYIVEGNIGAGKTTFLTLLKQYIPTLSVQLEPLNTWHSDQYGQSLLTKFYNDPHRWAYTMETFAMMCRVQEHIYLQKTASTFHIVERSIYSGHYAFALNGYEQGFMSALEWNMYLHWFDFLTSKCEPPLGFIYLSTDPNSAYERIHKRQRSGEHSIPFDYIEQIHNKHEDFLLHKKEVTAAIKNTPVLVLNCNQEFEDNKAVMQEHVSSIQQFLNTTNHEINLSRDSGIFQP